MAIGYRQFSETSCCIPHIDSLKYFTKNKYLEKHTSQLSLTTKTMKFPYLDLSSLSTKLESLPKEELDRIFSEEEQKAIYNFVQFSRILAALIWIFSVINGFSIGSLLNPQSSLITWSREHLYLVCGFSILFTIPTYILYYLSSKLEALSISLHKNLSSPGISPNAVWTVTAFALPFSTILLSCLTSFFQNA
jgi:hypothetical protein